MLYYSIYFIRRSDFEKGKKSTCNSSYHITCRSVHFYTSVRPYGQRIKFPAVTDFHFLNHCSSGNPLRLQYAI